MRVMFAHAFWLFQESDLLSWFVTDTNSVGWEETAQSWVIASAVIAVVCAGLMLAYKWLKKHTAENINKKIWSRGETVVLMLIGLFPVILLSLLLWYTDHDFFDIVGGVGLVKGIFLGWVLYLLLMFAGHVASPWRREIL
jgi:hypothetical protein